MQKKVLVVAAVLALFVCGGAFAQEAEVPETEAPAAESSGGGGSSILDSMYAGLDIGTDFGSFYMAPRVGITPFKKVPKLAFEFLFGMYLGGKYQFDIFAHKDEPDWEINIFTPSILVSYTFSDWMIRPYAGLGFGVNFFAVKDDKTWAGDVGTSGEFEVENQSLKIKPSFNTLLTAGAKYAIPNTNFELNAGLNLSFTQLEYEDTKKYKNTGLHEKNEFFFLLDYDIVIGAVYHF